MKSQTLDVRLYDTPEALATIRSEWNQLLADFPSTTTFSTLEWLLPWWRAFGKDQRLRVVAFYDSKPRLVAVAPLSVVSYRRAGLKFNVLRFMGDGSGDSDNLDLPVVPGYELPFIDSLLEFLRNGVIDWDFCQLNTVPDNSPAAAALLSRLKEGDYCHFVVNRPWLVTNFPSTWEEYLNQLSGQTRNNLKRYTRRLERHYRVDIYKCTEETNLKNCLEDLFFLHQKRWKLRGEPGSFGSIDRRSFYYELSCALLKHDCLEFWLLTLNGKAAAAQFCFRYRDTVFLLQEGFDPDHSSDRVGFVLRGHVLERLLAAGIRRYDFLFGQSEGKAMWVPQVRHYRNIHFARPRSFGSSYLRVTNAAKGSKEWLRRHAPTQIWAVLHGLNVMGRSSGRKHGTHEEDVEGVE
jgi:CelD/BcsL family acetyltransferase involved in cellulose biosynthesis